MVQSSCEDEGDGLGSGEWAKGECPSTKRLGATGVTTFFMTLLFDLQGSKHGTELYHSKSATEQRLSR